MTKLIHDQFAKDYLEELLKPYGEVKPAQKIPAEVREVDLLFIPTPAKIAEMEQNLGLLGKIAQTSVILEPFRNAVTDKQIRSCLSKLITFEEELERDARREEKKFLDPTLPLLWILTPTASKALLSRFGGRLDESWVNGVYFSPKIYQTAIVVIHQLPEILDTLWLRLLGKGGCQKKAIDELESLSQDNPVRKITLSLLYNFQRHLNALQEINSGDREVIMRLAPLYQQDRELAFREGEQQGLQQGLQQGQRRIAENILINRFGSLDESLAAIIEPIIALPPEQFIPLLLNLSKDELLSRFQK